MRPLRCPTISLTDHYVARLIHSPILYQSFSERSERSESVSVLPANEVSGRTVVFLLLLRNHLVAVVAGADRVAVEHIGDEDTPVAHFAGVRLAEQDLNGRLHEDVAADDGDTHALNDVGGVLHTAIDALLPLLPDAMHIGVLKPIDVGCQQGFLHLIKLGLADDCFNLFHTYITLCWELRVGNCV